MTTTSSSPSAGMVARNTEQDDADLEGPISYDTWIPLIRHRKLLVGAPLAVGILAIGASFLMTPIFTSRTAFLPPQQQQSAAASALSSLGALGGLAGVAAGIRSPGDQYVALIQSVTVADRLIDEFKLMEVYESEYRFLARRELAKNMRVTLGKKDGLITVEVDDADPQRAAAIANRSVDELRRMTERLALTEAQQRRVFFEGQLKAARERLAQAQKALQDIGFTKEALKAEPKAAAEGYAKLKAEVTNAEVRVQALRQNLLETAPEVQVALATAAALRKELAKVEGNSGPGADAGYVSKYRDYKYQETLFDLFARQYELARVDESRDGPLIQVIDPGTPAERKSRPKRALIGVGATLLAFAALVAGLLGREAWRKRQDDPEHLEAWARLKQAWRE